MPSASAIYTIGHGNRSTEELLEILERAGVRRLVDVRAHPGSRHNPHFSRDALAASLSAAGLVYEWQGDALGGRRRAHGPSRHPAWREASFRAYADYMDTPPFRGALEALEADADRGPPLAVMCAETVWWRCHRRLIADALVAHGRPVIHLLGPSASTPHPLHPDARIDEQRHVVYDRNTTTELFSGSTPGNDDV